MGISGRVVDGRGVGVEDVSGNSHSIGVDGCWIG